MTVNFLTTKHGARLFSALAEPAPESALECLKRTIGTWDREKLFQFTTGRREVIWALEKIAMWRNLFPDASRLLLALGEAENESYSNNASGIFTELFSTAYGRLAPTEAPPQQRFPILQEVLESKSKERRMLALRACDRALEIGPFVRPIGAQYQGLRMEPKLWLPKTYGELFDAYQQVWQMLQERLDNLEQEEQQQAVNILLQRARGIGRIQALSDMVINTIDELAKKRYVDKKDVLAKVVQILHFEGKELPEQTRNRWEELKNNLTGSDFSSLMKRHVGMQLVEEEYDERGNRLDKTQSRIVDLAQQAIENHELLQAELEWLVTTEAQNGYRFGYELGMRDKDFSLLEDLLDAQQEATDNTSAYFLGGYFRALFERNSHEWEKQLDAISEDKKLNIWVPELTWRSGMSDRAALRLLDLAEGGVIRIDHFEMFRLGSVIQDLSKDVFEKLIEFFLGQTEMLAISIALDLFHFYYLRKESKHVLPEELTLRLLNHPLLFRTPGTGGRNQMDGYHWAGIGKAFVELHPSRSLEVADKMLQHFEEDGSILEGFHSETQGVLNVITRQYPREIWKRIIQYLGPPVDSRAFRIQQWLRGGEFFEAREGALTLIHLERIWEWVDEDIEKRAPYIASFVPKGLFREEGRPCLAREVLARYGEREDVRTSFTGNILSEGWMGPTSLHYQKKREELLEFKKEENNESVKRWIDEYVTMLNGEIRRARIEEERRDF